MKRFLNSTVSLGVSLGLIFPVTANAWGPLGHQVTAEIAARHLTPEARSGVEQLLRNDNFHEASLWPDHIKRDSSWVHTKPYHFADVADGLNYLDNLRSLPHEEQSKGDVVMTLLKILTVFRTPDALAAGDPQLRAQEKFYALKFLIHFIADMHQPLHAGHPSDRGGNDIRLKWFGKPANLHQIWDTNIITSAHENDFKGRDSASQILWYADYLESRNSIYEGCDLDFAGWLDESVGLARDYAYNGNYRGSNTAYMNTSIPVIESQLVRGGMRLACFLNYAFMSTNMLLKPLPKVQALSQEIGSIIGRPVETVVSLTPMSGWQQREARLTTLADDDGHDQEDCH